MMMSDMKRIADALERIADSLQHLHIDVDHANIDHAHIDDIGEIHGDVVTHPKNF
jgi:hypothetical protein